MKEHWKLTTIEAISEVVTKGTTPTSVGFKFTESGVNFVKVETITPNGQFLSSKFGYIDEDCHQSLKRSQLVSGDILFSIAGALGRTARVTPEILPANTNQALAIIRLKPSHKVMPEFILRALSSGMLIEQIEKQRGGVAQQNLSLAQVKNFQIPIPPLPEQKRIVAILDEAFEGIDSAIANTEKNLANSRELFENYLQNLDAEKESLGNLVDIRTGKLDANAATEDGQYPFFTCSREIYKIDSFAFDCEAILLAGNNAVGDFNVKHYKGQFNAYQRTYVITVNTEKKILYRYLYFQMLKSLKEFKLQSVGAGTKFLKLGMIQDLRIALPTIEKQQEIISTLDKLKAETQRLETIYRQKLAALKELKQSILQKAFTGELTADTSKTVKEKIAA
jgi:type I restriction enzyme S subunit